MPAVISDLDIWRSALLMVKRYEDGCRAQKPIREVFLRSNGGNGDDGRRPRSIAAGGPCSGSLMANGYRALKPYRGFESLSLHPLLTHWYGVIILTSCGPAKGPPFAPLAHLHPVQVDRGDATVRE
jgi:hypothetical protein